MNEAVNTDESSGGWIGHHLVSPGNALFAASDRRAHQRGWEVTRTDRGLGRVYRDPRWASRAVPTPSAAPTSTPRPVGERRPAPVGSERSVLVHVPGRGVRRRPGGADGRPGGRDRILARIPGALLAPGGTVRSATPGIGGTVGRWPGQGRDRNAKGSDSGSRKLTGSVSMSRYYAHQRALPSTILWRWRYEALLVMVLTAVALWLGGGAVSAPVLGILAVVVAAAGVTPVVRQAVVAVVWRLVTPHRVRVACAASMQLHLPDHRLPPVLYTRLARYGERVVLWCLPGVPPQNYDGARDVLRAACCAREVRVLRHPWNPNIVILDIVRRGGSGLRLPDVELAGAGNQAAEQSGSDQSGPDRTRAGHPTRSTTPTASAACPGLASAGSASPRDRSRGPAANQDRPNGDSVRVSAAVPK